MVTQGREPWQVQQEPRHKRKEKKNPKNEIIKKMKYK
jgi:hypothetical protein